MVQVLLELDIPCELCRYSVDVSSGGIILTYCSKRQEYICDRQWINPVNCWRYCQCSRLSENTCPYFEPIDNEQYRRNLVLARKVIM